MWLTHKGALVGQLRLLAAAQLVLVDLPQVLACVVVLRVVSVRLGYSHVLQPSLQVQNLLVRPGLPVHLPLRDVRSSRALSALHLLLLVALSQVQMQLVLLNVLTQNG